MAGTFALRRTHGATRRSRHHAASGVVRRELRPRDADRFLDAVIMISVALFMLLFTGVGLLVLQNSLR